MPRKAAEFFKTISATYPWLKPTAEGVVCRSCALSDVEMVGVVANKALVHRAYGWDKYQRLRQLCDDHVTSSFKSSRGLTHAEQWQALREKDRRVAASLPANAVVAAATSASKRALLVASLIRTQALVRQVNDLAFVHNHALPSTLVLPLLLLLLLQALALPALS